LAGFQVIIYGRFWVFTEVVDVVDVESDDLQSPGLNLQPIVI